MRGMTRNERTFWYSLFLKNETTHDQWGNENGTRPVYGKPVETQGNISASRGSVGGELFGLNAEYSRTINPMPINCPIEETTVLWIDKTPVMDSEGKTTTGHDYVVEQVAQSLNHKAYAISKVNIADGVGTYGT